MPSPLPNRADTLDLIAPKQELFTMNPIWRTPKEKKQPYHLKREQFDKARYDPNNGIAEF